MLRLAMRLYMKPQSSPQTLVVKMLKVSQNGTWPYGFPKLNSKLEIV